MKLAVSNNQNNHISENEILEKIKNFLVDLSTRKEITKVLHELCKLCVNEFDFKVCYAGIYSEKKEELTRIQVYPKNKLVIKTLDILGINLKTDSFKFAPHLNETFANLINGETVFSDSFYELVSPNFNKQTCDLAQKLTRVKSMISVPFFHNGKFYGRLLAGSVKPIENHQIYAIETLAKNTTLLVKNSIDTAKLTEANIVLEQTVASVLHPIVIIDTNFNILSINEEMLEFIKNQTSNKYLNEAKTVGEKCYKLINNSTSPCSACFHIEAIKKGKIVREYKDKIYGKIYKIEISPLTNDKGKNNGTIHIMHDITDEKTSSKMADFQFKSAILVSETSEIENILQQSANLLEEIFELNCLIYAQENKFSKTILIDKLSPNLLSIKKRNLAASYLQDVINETMQIKSPIIINEFDSQPNIGGITISPKYKELSPLVCLPIEDIDKHSNLQENILGVLLIKPDNQKIITEKDLSFYKIIAERLSLSIKKTSSISEISRRNYELKFINETFSKMSLSFDIASIIKESLESVLSVLNIKSGAINLSLGNDEKQLFYEKNVSDKCLKWAIKTKSKKINTIKWENNYYDKNRGISSCSAIPITIKNKQIGSIYICLPKEKTLSEDDLNLIFLLAKQIGLAIERAQLYQNIEKERKAQEKLSRKIIESVEFERKRISMDLHDNLLQLLVGSEYLIQSIKAKGQTNERIKKIQNIISEAISAGRQLIKEIMPPSLEALNLSVAIEKLLIEATSNTNIKIKFKGNVKIKVPEKIKLALYRISQEAFLNSTKHANPSLIECSLELKNNSVVLCISDNGNSFNIKDKIISSMNNGHIGLLSMKERAAICGGTLDISSSKKRGTIITAKIPL